MKRVLLIIAIILLTPWAFAQKPAVPDAGAPELPKQAGSAKDLVPPGWEVEREVKGDLNQDAVPDLVLVMRPADMGRGEGEENMAASHPRILVVAMASAAGYQLALSESRLLSRPPSPKEGARLKNVVIEDGMLSVRLFYRKYDYVGVGLYYSFRYQDSRFELRRFSEETTEHVFSFGRREVTIDYLDGKAKLTDSHEKLPTRRNRRKTMPAGAPPTIESLGNGWMFQPEPCAREWWDPPSGRAKSRTR
jgi:hypothetical protein